MVIFFRVLSLIALGAIIVAGIVHTVKCIFKYHDVDAVSELVIIIIAVCMAVAWAIPLH